MILMKDLFIEAYDEIIADMEEAGHAAREADDDHVPHNVD